jgi:hypothetical protein
MRHQSDNRVIKKSLCDVNNPHTTDDLKMAITEYIRNVDRVILNTVFENTVGVSVNVWRLAGDALNITCNFLYCNLHVHRDSLITLHNDKKR